MRNDTPPVAEPAALEGEGLSETWKGPFIGRRSWVGAVSSAEETGPCTLPCCSEVGSSAHLNVPSAESLELIPDSIVKTPNAG